MSVSDKKLSSDESKKTDEDHKSETDIEVAPQQAPKSKLDISQLTLFGFTTEAQAKAQEQYDDRGGGGGTAAGGKKPQKNRNVVYGADDDDIDQTDFDDDYNPDVDYDSDEFEDSEGDEDAEDEGEDTTTGLGRSDFGNSEYDADDMWEDEEEEEHIDDEEAEEAALLAEQMERERQREERLIEIKKKKEILIDRYLKVARLMIHHRKKNIFLQDYLYHLALRKGILRGDSFEQNSEEQNENILTKAQKERQRRKNANMASRFARFLRKTGTIIDEYGNEAPKPEEHHHRHGDRHRHQRSRKLLHDIGEEKLHHGRHRHHHRKELVRVVSGKCFGNECPSSTRKLYSRNKNHPRSLSPRSRKGKGKSKLVRPLTLKEQLERKAAVTIKAVLQKSNKVLHELEHHRCRMARKKQTLKLSKYLERQFNGMGLLDPERNHLISFVEHSVTAQNLAKRKALRRNKQEKENKTVGVANMNHQWLKSLDRIRELRLQKAKLEQEHRLQLIRKVKHWHIWEKRDLTALEAVYEFITKMGSRVNMTKRETETFTAGLETFHKQLCSLHEAMISQVIKMFKARSMLYMAQRRIRDDASVHSVKGFTIVDYQRMIIENLESRDKLMERQHSMIEEHEKLKTYVGKVATSHMRKQASWGALRAGRHDMKALWELCTVERDNLLKKLREIEQAKRLHRRMFKHISLYENSRCFADYRRVENSVKRLNDKQRMLQTQLHQTHSVLRALNVKVEDTRQRIERENQEKLEKVAEKDIAYCKETIGQRIDPRPPNTIHGLNMTMRKSQNIVLNMRTPSQNQINQTVTNAPMKKGGKKRPKIQLSY